jgi:hypothetical protein
MSDIYHVDAYTDKELYDILDLFNPSDRELEAKILFYIRKYENITTSDGIEIYHFFNDIYKRFFEVVDSIEGFEGNDTTKPTEIDTQIVSSVTYSGGSINPLLKQTYQRTISIDSQYRDSKTDLATNFTFNFTEILKDVVSIKLYAIQIPYTWYTISQSYGSNFIYLKGITTGITSSFHDISINITPGNYNQSNISSAIQTQMLNLSKNYTDISFGSTNLIYDPLGCKASFNIDIQKSYNESSYILDFSNILVSPYPYDNPYRTYYLSSFLGFNSLEYSTSFVRSYIISAPLSTTVSSYCFNTSNNVINIIQYYIPGNLEYDPSNVNLIVYKTIPISFPIDGVIRSQSSIYDIVKNVISSHINLIDSSVSFSQITGTDSFSQVFDNSGSYYFQWNIKLNRYNINYVPESKLVLQIPINETLSPSAVYPIWTMDLTGNSCFYFTSNITHPGYYELNTLISESNIYTSNFEISGNVYYQFTCNDSLYNRNGTNDISYGLLNNFTGYSLDTYLKEINNGFVAMNNKVFNLNGNKDMFNLPAIGTTVYSRSEQSAAYYDISDSTFHMSVDINRNFYTNNFRIDLSGTFLQSILRFDASKCSVPLFDDISFSAISSFSATYDPYANGSNPLLMVVYPDNINSINNGFSIDVSYHLFFPINKKYVGFKALMTGIQDVLNNYSDKLDSNPLKNSMISIVNIPQTDQILTVLTINIVKVLTQVDYTLSFVDVQNSSWKNNLFLNSSYKLIDYNVNSYSDISGNKMIHSDNIILNEETNVFFLKPFEEGVLEAGDISFNIPSGIYSRVVLFDIINGLFNANPITSGTTITFLTDTENNEYTKIRWNINKVYTSSDYKIVFYDLYSFVSCFLGNSSVRNATKDTTLGWIMGFRDLTEYSLLPTNILNNYFYDYSSTIKTATNNLYTVSYPNKFRTVITLTGDTTVSVNLYSYFMVVLDDFNPSHLNDGLVTITPKDNNLSLPSYANRAKYMCDPITNQVLNTGITDVASNNLTQNQIYSINQIINTQNTKKSYVNQGVYVSDIFGLIPIKTSGYTPGQIYVEFGGTLQAQERAYFGPVNIHRMAIKLVNDRGELVDLNGANWSLQFICEQLYQSTGSENKKK